MNKISYVIIDDEPLAVKLLETFSSRVDFLQHKGSYTDSIAAIEKIRQNPVDLVFLDIQMPDINGMELARLLPKETMIIFTTAFKEYAYESYEVSAVDFLLKPIRYDKFLLSCEKAKELIHLKTMAMPAEKSDLKDIFIKVDGEIHKIKLDDVLYVEGMKDYVKFYMADSRVLITHLTMKKVESILPSDRFMRISRSHIVGLDHIRSIERNLCLHIGDGIIKVTDLYKPKFEDFLKTRLPQ